MITSVFTQNCIKILTLFSLAPGSRFNRTEIKDKVCLNNVPLDSSLQKLINSDIIKLEKPYYSINFENEYSNKIIEIVSKQFKQLKELPLNVYYSLMDLVNFLSTQKTNELILFGSYAKITYSLKSDIDIALLYSLKPNQKRISRIVLNIEKTYKTIIQIHYFEKKSFYKNKKDPLIKSILKDGVWLIRGGKA